MQLEAVGESYFDGDTRMFAVSRVRPLQLVTQAGGGTQDAVRAGSGPGLPLNVHYAINPVELPRPASSPDQQQQQQRPPKRQPPKRKGAWVP